MDMEAVLKQLDELFAKGKNSEVEPFLQGRLQQARAQGDDRAELTILNELIGYYRSVSRYGDAVKLFLQAVEKLESLHLVDTVQYATTLLNGATAYTAGGMADKAIELYRRAQDIFEAQLAPDDYRLAGLYNNLGALYRDREDYRHACALLQKALPIVDANPDDAIEAAVVRVNLAQMQMRLGEQQAAAGNLQRAMQLFMGEMARHPDAASDPHFSACLAGLAELLFYMGRKLDAAKLYELALLEINRKYGKNKDFATTCKNCADAWEACGNAEKATYYRKLAEGRSVPVQQGAHKKGLALAKEYYQAHGQEMIHCQFAPYENRIAVGLVGPGSECFGYDDALSADHDFGPGFCLWLQEKDYRDIGKQLQQAYSRLPHNFPDTGRKTKKDGRVGVFEIQAFYTGLIGRGTGDLSAMEWMQIPETRLATATNGAVFRDELGAFSRIREQLLRYYPKDVWLAKIAACTTAMGQSGQYNYARCMARGDRVAAFQARGEFVSETIKMMFLLNRRYRPFYKWAYRAMLQLPVLLNVGELVQKLVQQPLPEAAEGDINQRLMEEICGLVLAFLQQEGLTDFHSSFLPSHSGYIAAPIENRELCNLIGV